MVLLGCLGRFVKVTRVCGIERGIPNPKKRGLRDCGPSRVASAAFEMMREWPRTRAQESIYGGDTKRGGLDPILNKAMRASYFYFCVSMLRSENPRGGSKALARAEGSVGAPQSSSRPSGMDSSLSAMHVLLLDSFAPYPSVLADTAPSALLALFLLRLCAPFDASSKLPELS